MRSAVALAFALVVVLPRPGLAQQQPSPDFLFGQPRAALSIRTGLMVPRARSDIFTFVEDQLTLTRRDFNAPMVGVDADFTIAPRLSAVASYEYSRSQANSEYRNFVDNQRLPIKQSTGLQQSNITGGLRFDLAPRGRQISPHAWIPAAITPFVGVGAGLMHYSFSQTGDFVDFVDSSVFPHSYSSRGWSPGAYVFGGADLKAWRQVYFTGEMRYLWSQSDLGNDFTGFQPIDLAGFKMTGGIRYIF